MDNLHAIAEQHIQRWNPTKATDNRLDDFKRKFVEWLSQIPETVQPEVLRLLEGFQYYTHEKTNGLLVSLHELLLAEYSVHFDETIYTFIKSVKNITNSSNDYWTEYKLLNKLNKNVCIVDPDALDADEWEGIKNIVFIDDCSGSGKTFCDYITERQRRYQGKNIFFITIHIMDEANRQIQKTSGRLNLNIQIVNSTIQSKAFTSKLFGDDEKPVEAKDLVVRFSETVKIPRHEILGFEESESLMAFYNNTPNNTLGFLRYDTKCYFSIFPREKTVLPNWRKAAKEKQSRKIRNYNASIK